LSIFKKIENGKTDAMGCISKKKSKYITRARKGAVAYDLKSTYAETPDAKGKGSKTTRKEGKLFISFKQ